MMLLPEEHLMEQLNVAYVTAVVAKAGATYDPPRQDYGIDARISEVRRFPDGKYRATNWIFNCQLKATKNFDLKDDVIVYEMDVEAYNRLVSVDGNTSRILVVLCLPKDWEDWLFISEDQLILKRCCYWAYFTGSPSQNNRSKTVYISRKNVFTPESVQLIFQKIKSGEDLNGLAIK